MRVNFREISIKVTKRWKDSNGKLRQETRKFFQTLNPWNRTEDGELKTVEQIKKEIEAECREWLAKPETDNEGE